MYQKFRYSRFVKGITAIYLFFVLGLTYYLVAVLRDLKGFLGGLAVLIIGAVWPYLRSPKAVYWDDIKVILYRQYGKIEFSTADHELSREDGIQLVLGMRLWASGGYLEQALPTPTAPQEQETLLHRPIID